MRHGVHEANNIVVRTQAHLGEVVVGSIDNHPMLEVGYKSYLFVRNASVLLLESYVHYNSY